MSRPILYRTDTFAYHVTVRSNNKEWFYIPIEECWEILTRSLAKAAERYGSEIHTFVLMSNHFHILVSTPLQNLDDLMRYFLSVGTKAIQKRANRINHIFGGRYRWTVLDSAYALAYVYKYIVRNPVRAGMCSRVQDYPFSTLNTLTTPLPLVEGFDQYWSLIPRDPIERLTWLNIPTSKEEEELIGRALRRYKFEFTTNSNCQKMLRNLKINYAVEKGDRTVLRDLLVPKVD